VTDLIPSAIAITVSAHDGDFMPDETTRLRCILSEVSYKDWALDVKLDPHRNLAPYMQWRFKARCAKSGECAEQAGRKWYLSPHMTESELVLTAFKAALTAEEHECREQFSYRGHRILNPHVSVQALISICAVQDVRS
jgi:hypothetical protein